MSIGKMARRMVEAKKKRNLIDREVIFPNATCVVSPPWPRMETAAKPVRLPVTCAVSGGVVGRLSPNVVMPKRYP